MLYGLQSLWFIQREPRGAMCRIEIFEECRGDLQLCSKRIQTMWGREEPDHTTHMLQNAINSKKLSLR